MNNCYPAISDDIFLKVGTPKGDHEGDRSLGKIFFVCTQCPWDMGVTVTGMLNLLIVDWSFHSCWLMNPLVKGVQLCKSQENWWFWVSLKFCGTHRLHVNKNIVMGRTPFFRTSYGRRTNIEFLCFIEFFLLSQQTAQRSNNWHYRQSYKKSTVRRIVFMKKVFQICQIFQKMHTALRDTIRFTGKLDILPSSLLNKRPPSCHFILASPY